MPGSTGPILLVDIDGTLLSGCKAHGNALRASLSAVYGIEPVTEGLSFGGKTDRHLIVEIALNSGVSETLALKGVECCLNEMCSKFDELFIDEMLKAFEGADQTLRELEKRAVKLALVTGNPKPIAFSKLTRVGLAQYFETGGFGSDQHTHRSDLVELALKRLNFPDKASRENVYLIGDTVIDIEAAKLAGVKSIGVLTGSFKGKSYEPEIVAAKPDHIIPSVGATEKLCEILK